MTYEQKKIFVRRIREPKHCSKHYPTIPYKEQVTRTILMLPIFALFYIPMSDPEFWKIGPVILVPILAGLFFIMLQFIKKGPCWYMR